VVFAIRKRLILAAGVTALVLLPSWPLRLIAAIALLALLTVPRPTPTEPAEPRGDAFGPRFGRFRHDLLNDLQLVYGAVQLHKPAPEVLQRIDKAIWRIRAAGLIFGIRNWELSCCLFDVWEEAELSGIRLAFSASGDFGGATAKWPAWADGITAVWAYYRGLAEATGLTEVELELREEPRAWKLQFAAPKSPVTGSALPKKLDIALVSGARVKWSHQEHSVTLEVQKESPSEEEDLCL
jgi:hypothetical protein